MQVGDLGFCPRFFRDGPQSTFSRCDSFLVFALEILFPTWTTLRGKACEQTFSQIGGEMMLRCPRKYLDKKGIFTLLLTLQIPEQ
jgi:hypothetical protein